MNKSFHIARILRNTNGRNTIVDSTYKELKTALYSHELEDVTVFSTSIADTCYIYYYMHNPDDTFIKICDVK